MRLLSIVVNYRTPHLLDRFLESYHRFVNGVGRYLVVVDVCPTGEHEYHEEYKCHRSGDCWVTVDHNIGFAGAVNLAIDMSNLEAFDAVGIFNADTAFTDTHCVDSCLDLLADRVGVVGPLQLDSKGIVRHSGFYGDPSYPQDYGWNRPPSAATRKVQEAIYVSGSAMFVNRLALDDILDCETYMSNYSEGPLLPTPHYFEDRWLCEHLKMHGYTVMYNGAASMIHDWHQSSPIGGFADKFYEDSRIMYEEAMRLHGGCND